MPYFKKAILMITLCSLFLLFNFAFAGDENKQSKLNELVSLTGVKESIDAQVIQSKQQNKAIAKKMIIDTKSQFERYPESFYSEIEKAIYFFLNTMDEFINSSRLTEKYTEILSKHLTESEVEGLIEFYQTPIGKASVEATRKTNLEWTRILLEEYQKTLSKESAKYFKKVQGIAQEYR